MRNLIAFLLFGLAAAGASHAAAAQAAAPARPLTVAEKRALEAKAEAELAARIEKRIEEMRAMQRARAEQQAKTRKAAAPAKAPAARPAAVAPRAARWAYSGQLGPANWSKISEEWAACGSGKRQSPVDIRNAIPVDQEHIAFDYRLSPFSVQDNGHTIEVGVGEGNFIMVGERRYELVQFHFHRPSEERIDGKGFDMVAHLEHRARDGSMAVVAVMLEEGRALEPMQAAFDNLPLEKGSVARPAIVLDPAALLPEERGYYSYAGSLTTPPCTENVLWLVMKQPVQASPEQMDVFARLYPMNARPLQPAAGRVIKASN